MFSEPKSFKTKYSFGHLLTAWLLYQLECLYDLGEKEEKGKQAGVELGQAQLKLGFGFTYCKLKSQKYYWADWNQPPPATEHKYDVNIHGIFKRLAGR